MTASAEMTDNPKIMKFNTDYSHLSNLIISMTQEQQSLLLKKAHQIINEVNKSTSLNAKLNKNWIFILGFLLGWGFTSLLLIILAIS